MKSWYAFVDVDWMGDSFAVLRIARLVGTLRRGYGARGVLPTIKSGLFFCR